MRRELDAAPDPDAPTPIGRRACATRARRGHAAARHVEVGCGRPPGPRRCGGGCRARRARRRSRPPARRAHLAVGEADARERRPRPARGEHVRGPHASVGVDRDDGDGGAGGAERGCRFQHRRVLDGGGDQCTAGRDRAAQRQVVRLGGAAREHHLRGWRADQRGHLGAGRLERGAGMGALTVRARGFAGGRGTRASPPRLGAERCGPVVIQVDAHAGRTAPTGAPDRYQPRVARRSCGGVRPAGLCRLVSMLSTGPASSPRRRCATPRPCAPALVLIPPTSTGPYHGCGPFRAPQNTDFVVVEPHLLTSG